MRNILQEMYEVDHILHSANCPTIGVLLMVLVGSVSEYRRLFFQLLTINFFVLFSGLQEEFHKTNFAACLRTVDEFKEPFKSNDSPVRKAGLSLISIQTKVIPCSYRETWLNNGGDPIEHARWYVAGIKAWSSTTFVSGESIPVIYVRYSFFFSLA